MVVLKDRITHGCNEHFKEKLEHQNIDNELKYMRSVLEIMKKANYRII